MTPIYFYSVSGQMKVFLDRTVQLYGTSYRYRTIYLLASSESDDRSSMDGAIKTLQGWVDCMPGTTIAGIVYGTGALMPGEVKQNQAALAEAYTLGRSIR